MTQPDAARLRRARTFAASPRVRRFLLVFIGAVAAQLLFNAMLPADLAGNDSSDFHVMYRPAAESLYEGRGLTIDGGPATIIGPGYPVILAGSFLFADAIGFGHDVAIDLVRLVSVGLGAVALLALFERLFERRTALLATALWVVFPLNLFLGKQPNSELPFRVVLYAALLAYTVGVQRRRPELLAGAGALLGMATLIRPAGLLFVAALALPLAVRSLRSDRSLRWLAGALVAANVAVLIPYQAWVNTRTDQVAVVSTVGPLALVDGLTIGTDPDEEPVSGFSSGALAIMQDATAQRPELTSTPDVVAFATRAAARHPVGFADLVAVKTARAWYGTDSRTGELFAALIQLPVLVLAAFGIWHARRTERLGRLAATVTIGIPLCAWLTTVAVQPLARYMMPTEALLFPYVAISLERCATTMGQLRR